MFKEVRLLTRFGDYVVTVKVVNYRPPPEVIAWGGRHFVNRDGRYLEGLAVVAFATVPERQEPRTIERSLAEKVVSRFLGRSRR